MNKTFNKFVTIVFLLLGGVLPGCNTSDEGEPIVEQPAEPGFGNSTEDTEGIPFQLPSGITLVGNQVHTPDFCLTPDELINLLVLPTREKILGTPGFFIVCVTFTNSTSNPITIKCPAGITFIAERDENERPKGQNGITVSDVFITISAGLTQSFLLDVYCLNSSRTRPAMETSFSVGPVTENKEIKKLIEMLKDKNIRNDQVGENWAIPSTVIQTAVWNIADNNEISETTLADLGKL